MNINNLNIDGGENSFTLRFNFKYTLITTLLIIVCAAAYQFYPRIDNSNEALFDSYYKEPHLTTRVSDAEAGAMFKGIALIKEEKYGNAISKFEEIIADRNFYSEAAQWYMLLCLLKTNATDSLITDKLCKIITDRETYSTPALEILTKRYEYKQKKQP